MKTRLHHLLFLFIFTGLFACNTKTPGSENDEYAAAIEESHRLIDSVQQSRKVPGIDAALYIDGEMVWQEAFGYADLEQEVPVIPGETKFRIGSVSKPLTSAALGKLMDAGKIDVDEPVQSYAPYFPEKKFPITVKEVGGHIAGIRHYRGEEFLLNKPYASVKASLSIFDQDTLLFEPKSNYSYSSYGFNLISAIIEGASGKDFLNFMQSQVFSPLEMTNTCPDKNDSIIANRTDFYQLDSLGNVVNAPCVDNSYKWAGGGFISTTTDLIKFGKAHFEPGYLSEATLAELTTSQVLTNGDSTEYGIGWRTYNDGDLIGFGHTGGSVGGITAFRIYPEQKAILVLLSNSSDTDYGEVVDRILHLFLVEEPEPQLN